MGFVSGGIALEPRTHAHAAFLSFFFFLLLLSWGSPPTAPRLEGESQGPPSMYPVSPVWGSLGDDERPPGKFGWVD